MGEGGPSGRQRSAPTTIWIHVRGGVDVAPLMLLRIYQVKVMQHIAVMVVGGAQEQEQAARALWYLTVNSDANKAAIADAVAIAPWCGCWAATGRACGREQPGRWRI